jgi:hypothetical protein
MSSAFSALRASGRFRRSTRTAPCDRINAELKVTKQTAAR